MPRKNLEIRETIRQLVEDGVANDVIASRLNTTTRQVQRLRQDMGISSQKRIIFTAEQERQIELWLEDEVPLAEIARSLGVDKKVIQHRYKGRGAGKEGNLLSCRKLMAELGIGASWEEK